MQRFAFMAFSRPLNGLTRTATAGGVFGLGLLFSKAGAFSYIDEALAGWWDEGMFLYGNYTTSRDDVVLLNKTYNTSYFEANKYGHFFLL